MDQQRDDRRRRATPPPTADQQRSPIIEGQFTYDILEDLFLYLCRRRETLVWQLTTLAGEFSVVFDEGQPADCMFRPTRPIGAYVGMKALRTLFQQQGGQFSVSRSGRAPERRSLSGSGENLLIALAAQGDEHIAPAVLAGTTFDTSAELALVQDLPPDTHRTAFLTSSTDTPLADVLQLFSVSRRAYRVSLFALSAPSTSSRWLGQIELSAHQVIGAAAGEQRGQAAFQQLLNFADILRIEVSPSSDTLPIGHEPLGKLDKLLLSAVLGAEPRPAPEAEASQVKVEGPPLTAAALPLAGSVEVPSPLQRLGKFLRRK